jgi:hypothetical protein
MTLQTFLNVSVAQNSDDADMFCSQRRAASPKKTLETLHETLLVSELIPASPLDSIKKMTTQHTAAVTVPPPIL